MKNPSLKSVVILFISLRNCYSIGESFYISGDLSFFFHSFCLVYIPCFTFVLMHFLQKQRPLKDVNGYRHCQWYNKVKNLRMAVRVIQDLVEVIVQVGIGNFSVSEFEIKNVREVVKIEKFVIHS